MFENQISSEQTRKEIFTAMSIMIDRRKGSFTMEELAEMLNTTRQTIHNFETGKTFNFNLFDQYCGLFGFKINILHDRTEQITEVQNV